MCVAFQGNHHLAGAAYIYDGSGSSWSLKATLVPPYGGTGDSCGGGADFGTSTVVVSCVNSDYSSTNDAGKSATATAMLSS